MIVYSRVTDNPAFEPVTLTEAKVHLEYSGTLKDDFILTLITTARRLCESYTGLSFITQERMIKLDRFPMDKISIEVPYGPVQAITGFTYTNEVNATITLVENTGYVVDTHSALCRIYPIGADGTVTSWPTDVKVRPHPISITYQTGYDDVSGQTMPSQIKQAMLLQIASMFENRTEESTGGISHMINWNSAVILDTLKVSWNANVE